MNYKVYHSGPLMAIRYPAGEKRSGNRLQLASPPRLFVIAYDEETDQISSEPITWTAASAMSANDVAFIGNAMMNDRMMEAAAADLARKAAAAEERAA